MTANDTVSLSAVLRTIQVWDEEISNTQQYDMPGFVRHYTPRLVERIEALGTPEEPLTRVKTAFHRLADRIEHDDENTVKVPLSEILMYTDENRAKIARMLRREADSF